MYFSAAHTTEETDHVQNVVVSDPAQRSGHVRAAGAAIAVERDDLGGWAICAGKVHCASTEWARVLEFREYEDWPTVAVSKTGELIEVILADP